MCYATTVCSTRVVRVHLCVRSFGSGVLPTYESREVSTDEFQIPVDSRSSILGSFTLLWILRHPTLTNWCFPGIKMYILIYSAYPIYQTILYVQFAPGSLILKTCFSVLIWCSCATNFLLLSRGGWQLLRYKSFVVQCFAWIVSNIRNKPHVF